MHNNNHKPHRSRPKNMPPAYFAFPNEEGKEIAASTKCQRN